MLGTLAAVAARATARAAERYGRRRILTTITGGVTLADVLLRATTKELSRSPPQRTASLLVPVKGKAGFFFLNKDSWFNSVPKGKSKRKENKSRWIRCELEPIRRFRTISSFVYCETKTRRT
jgi:hypothetical protein